jgi:translocation and assembly module TamA
LIRHRIYATLLCGAIGAAPLWAAPLETFSFDVTGADDAVANRLRGASVLVPLADQSVDDPQEVLAAARAEYSRLLGALYDMGHYGGVITVSIDGREAASIPALETPPRIRSVVVTVSPGPVYTFSRAGVAPVAEGTDIPEGYAAGEPARTSAIRATAQAAVTGWRRLGYAKAEISDQSIVADHRSDTVASDLRLAPGRQLRYGTITVRGANRVREDRILYMSGLRRADQTFNPDELERAANRIRRSGAFRSVAVVEAEQANPDGTIDITLQVAEERRRRYGIGFEFSTVEGFGIDAFWLHRNLFGGAERLLIEGNWTSIGGNYTGGEDFSLSARFTRTSSFGPDTDFYIFTEVEELNEPTFNSSSASVEVGYTRIVGENLNVAAAVGLQFTSVREDGETTEYYMLTLPLQATYDTRDSILNATRGFYLDADVTPFLGFDETDSGLYVYGDGRTYYTVGESVPVTLAGRLQVGSIAGARLDRVPNDMRFFSGGGGTVRGQDYESLGITLNGQDSGGASLVVLTAEARAAVTDTIGVVAFADFGVVGADPFIEDWGNNQSGAGLGLRYITPVGPLRVDVAFPVEGVTDADSYYLYIGIGQAF